MLKAYREGKDLYATIAMGVYHNNYWDNMEHHEDGTPNPEGKKRRGNCKQVLLGIMYGLGVPNLAERMGISIREAQDVMNSFYESFPKVKEWQDYTKEFAKKNGYVEDIWGRRRRLPEIQLPQFSITEDTSNTLFNPIIGCSYKNVPSNKVNKFKEMLNEDLKKPGKERKASILDTINRAKKEGVTIIDNSGKLIHAENQCVNARIQGSAATMTKIAMRKIYDDEELRKLGFVLLIGVHDELIGECPKENATRVSDRLTNIMRHAVSDLVDVPFKCDADICDHWYKNDYANEIVSEYRDIVSAGMNREDAFYVVAKNHIESTKDELRNILNIKQ